MQYMRVLSRNVLLLVALLCCSKSFADTAEFNSQKFIEIASIRSISEIETAKIAMEKAASPAVHAYAQAVLAENMVTLDALRNLANESHLQMLSDAELQAKAHKYVFERRGQTFDVAYASMRAIERRKMVNLFREAINSDNVTFKHYAATNLPVLMRELYKAQGLVESLNSTSSLLASNP